MSFQETAKYMDAKPIEIEDGHIFIAPPSVMDTAGTASVVVVCKKHKLVPIPVEYSFLTQMFTEYGLVDAATKALKQCAGCLHEKEYETSRFPNAGGPGGAEL
jgi:hypothetical protein